MVTGRFATTCSIRYLRSRIGYGAQGPEQEGGGLRDLVQEALRDLQGPLKQDSSLLRRGPVPRPASLTVRPGASKS